MRAWALYFKAPTQRQHSRSAAAASLRFVLGTVGNGRKARRAESQRIVSCTHTGAAIRHRRTAMQHRANNVSMFLPHCGRPAHSTQLFVQRGHTVLTSRVLRLHMQPPKSAATVRLLRRCVGVQKFLCRLEESCCMGQQRDTQNIHGNAAAAPAPAPAQEAAAAARIHILAWAWAEPTTTSQ